MTERNGRNRKLASLKKRRTSKKQKNSQHTNGLRALNFVFSLLDDRHFIIPQSQQPVTVSHKIIQELHNFDVKVSFHLRCRNHKSCPPNTVRERDDVTFNRTLGR
jgi:hypothetical protein